MNVDEFFESKYLNAADLNGHEVKVTIDRCEAVQFKDGSVKPSIFFVGKKKGMVLNKTNTMKLKAQWGGDMDQWAGHEVILYPDTTDFQGRMVDCLRVRPVLPVVATDDPEDGIPF